MNGGGPHTTRSPVFSAVTMMAAMHPLGGKTARALVVMGTLLAVPYLSPRLRALRLAEVPWDRAPPAATVAAAKEQALSVGEATLSASKNEPTVTNALPETETPRTLEPTYAIEDESSAMDAFYTHLAATLRKEEVTRILHYGDSLLTSDFISGTMRRRMQTKFGDAGHGFILLANPWEWYFHNDVAHS